MATGKSRSDFPGAFIPFDRTGRQVPSVAIDAAPTSQLCINNEWLPFAIGALKVLSRPETWDDTYDHAVIAASEFAALIGNITDGCGSAVPSKGCFQGDFTDLDYGFVPTPGGACMPVWTHGIGWEMCADSTPQGHLQIKREFGGATLIRSFHLKLTTVVPYLINIDVTLYHDGTFTSIYSNTAATGPDITIDVTGLTEVASACFIEILETFGGAAADTILTEIGFCYTGIFPLSGSTDTFAHDFNFADNDGGFTSPGSPTYTGGTGHWDGTSWVSDCTEIHPPACEDVCEIEISFSARLVTGVDIYYDAGSDALSGNRQFRGSLSGTTTFTGGLDTGAGGFVTTDDVFANMDHFIVGVDSSSDTAHAVNRILRIVVRGIGTDPF